MQSVESLLILAMVSLVTQFWCKSDLLTVPLYLYTYTFLQSVTECIYSSTVLKYNFVVLYLSMSILCHFRPTAYKVDQLQ